MDKHLQHEITSGRLYSETVILRNRNIIKHVTTYSMLDCGRCIGNSFPTSLTRGLVWYLTFIHRVYLTIMMRMNWKSCN